MLWLHPASEYDLKYPKVKRGEVYVCDFGKPYGSEQGYKRYAIIIQNNAGNFASTTTIVIPCTTSSNKNKLPVHLECTFSPKNMIDYDVDRVGSSQNTILAEQIRTVSKTRLRKYIGKLTPEFMKMVEDKVIISLQLGD